MLLDIISRDPIVFFNDGSEISVKKFTFNQWVNGTFH